jgi:hypothetical protein
MCRLSSYDVTPPGGYAFEQTEGIPRSFPALPTIESQAQAVSGFRRGNGLPRSSLRESITDVDRYCANVLLHCHRRWTVPVDPTADTIATAVGPAQGEKCKGCGAEIK